MSRKICTTGDSVELRLTINILVILFSLLLVKFINYLLLGHSFVLLGLQSLIQKLFMTAKLCLYLVVNLSNDLYECLLNVGRIESTGLNEGHSPVDGILLGFLK